MSKAETKIAPYVKGQAVTVTSPRSGATASGTVVEVVGSSRGPFVSVDLGEQGVKKFRPASVSLA